MLEGLQEEFNRLRTDKLLLIACLIIPICVNLLVGLEFKSGVIEHVPMAIVDYDDSQLSRQIIRYFNEDDAFTIQYQMKDEKALQNLLDTSQVRVGMVIPKHFSEDVTSLKSPTILMLYDGSHMSMTAAAKAKASEILISVRVGASMQQIENRLEKTEEEAFTMAMPISFETRTLYNPARNFSNFMTPGYGTIICQLGIGLTGVLCVTINWDKKKKRSELGYIASKILFYGILGSLAITTNMLIQVHIMKIPCRGSLLLGIALGILFMFSVASLAVALSAWFRNRVLAMALSGLLLIPNSVMAGYTWPVISMLPSYKWMAKWIPFTHFGDNIRDLFLKGSMVAPLKDAGYLIFFLVIMTLVGTLGIYIRKMGKQREADDR